MCLIYVVSQVYVFSKHDVNVICFSNGTDDGLLVESLNFENGIVSVIQFQKYSTCINKWM